MIMQKYSSNFFWQNETYAYLTAKYYVQLSTCYEKARQINILSNLGSC